MSAHSKSTNRAVRGALSKRMFALKTEIKQRRRELKGLEVAYRAAT